MFLTVEELEQLSGYKSKAKQCEWLRDHHIFYLKNKYDRPLVARAAIEKLLGLTENTRPSSTQPDEAALKKHLGLKHVTPQASA